MLGTLLLRPSLKLQNFATLHHTSPNYTSVHLSTLHFLSFTLHYLLILLNPITFPTALFHLTSQKTRHSTVLISKFISKIMNPFTALNNLSPFNFTFFPHLSYQPFTSLHFVIHANHIYNSLHFTSLHFFHLSYQPFTSLPFTFYRLHFPPLVSLRHCCQHTRLHDITSRKIRITKSHSLK